MEHYRLRKYRGPEVWARVRLAYEAGESGPSVARRLDVGLHNLKKKCRLEGWSRRDQARRQDLELAGERGAAPATGAGTDSTDPEAFDGPAVRRRALARADTLLSAGRAVEALAQLRAAEALDRLAATDAFRTEGPSEADFEAVRRKVEAMVEVEAREMAEALLAGGVRPGQRWCGAALRWRADTFGPDAAEQDRRVAEAEGWAGEYWDEEGRLR